MISWNLVRRVAAATTALVVLSGAGNSEARAADKPRAGKKSSATCTVIDLTHELNDKVPTYMRSESAQFRYEVLTNIEKNGFSSGVLRIPEHYGTHIDAACHFIKGAGTIESIDPNRLILQAVVIDVRKETKNNPDYGLTVEKIKSWEKNGAIPAGSAVLLLTGWQDRFGTPQRYRNPDAKGRLHFPGFSEEASSYLVQRKVYALGVDTLSIDAGASKNFGAHKQALAAGLYLIENLANLDKLPARGAQLFCGPLPIKGGTGSPARILAVVK